MPFLATCGDGFFFFLPRLKFSLLEAGRFFIPKLRLFLMIKLNDNLLLFETNNNPIWGKRNIPG